jgi:phosphoribosylanthranilate isomerase
MTRGLIKICGVTTADDAALAVELGVDLIGVNLYPQSPRYALPQNVPSILEAIGDTAEGIAVLVEPTKESLLGPAPHLAAMQTIQWHGAGHEPRPWLKRSLVAAFGIAGDEDLAAIRQYVDSCRREGCLPRAVLIDAVCRGLHGGTGKTAPWHALAGFDPGVPIILAGGLKPENVAEAIRTVRPDGVDVASGVEVAPGRKSREKMRRFVEAAREAFERN